MVSRGKAGGSMVAEDEGGWVSYCKSSNKAMRLPPVTGFNIRARILPEFQCQLKNVKHDLKGYYTAWWGGRGILSFFSPQSFFSCLIFTISLSVFSPLQLSCLDSDEYTVQYNLWEKYQKIKTYYTHLIKINVSAVALQNKSLTWKSWKNYTLQYPALISMWGLCSLILALVVIGAYCVPCVIVLWSKHTGSPQSCCLPMLLPGGPLLEQAFPGAGLWYSQEPLDVLFKHISSSVD